MRFHTTIEHSELLTKWERAYATHDAFAEAGDDGTGFGGTEESDLASKAEYDSLDAFLRSPAITPTEMRQKIATMRKRGPLHLDELCWNEEGITAYLDRLEADLSQMQSWPVSPAVLAAWTEWRAHDERYAAAVDDEESDAMLPERNRLYSELHQTACTTPGDFILKQYARLHGVIGSTLYGTAQKDGTGNLYDIDIDAEIMEGGLFEKIEYPALYRDIDDTDVGANLLAYGLPYFDAKLWMQRAAAVGQGVSLVQQQHGGWSLGVHFVYPEEGEGKVPTPRIRRERDRLLRILNFQCGTDRHRAVGDEIRAHWPHLVHPLPAEVLS